MILKRTVLVSQLIFEDGYLSIDMDNVKVSVKGSGMFGDTNRVPAASAVPFESWTTAYL